MTQFKALTIQSGVTTQIQNTNELIVGSGVDVGVAGALTLGSTTATSIALAQNVTVSGSKTFTVGTGLATLGGGLTVTGTTTFASLATAGVLHTDGSGVVSTSLVVDADVSATAAIAYSKLNLTGSIVNADIATGAAIAGTKVSPNFGAQAVTTSGNISTTGSGTVTSAGLLTASAALTVSTGALTVSALSTGIAHVSSSGVFSSSAVDLASADVTGVLPTGNQANQSVTLTGDVTSSGGTTAGATTVVAKIDGNTVSFGTLGSSQDGYVATWVNAGPSIQFKPAATVTAVTMGGDVSGLSSSATVIKINGTSVPATPSAAQVLIAQSGTASLWETLSQDVTMTTGGVVTVNGSHAATFAATGAITAATTVTAGTGLVATTGGLTVSAGGANITGTTAVTGNITATTSIAATTSLSAGTTITAGTGLTVTSGGASITGGTVTDTLNTTGLATLNSASVTTTLGVTGVSTLTGGVKTNSVDAITGVALVIGGTTATTVQLGKVGALTEVLGNFKVDGTETIIGASTFQNPVTFDGGDVTVADGYNLFTNSISSTGVGAGVLTVNGNAGLNLQYAGATALSFGSGTITVASPNVLSAASGAQIIATSSTGTTFTVLPNSVVAQTQAAGTPVYLTSGGVTTATDSSAIASSYFVGISAGAGLGTFVTGIVTVTGPTVVGAPVYLSTAGALTSTAPGTGVVAQVGILVASGKMLIQVTTPVAL